MSKNLLEGVVLLLWVLGTGCPNGTGWTINLGDDDDSAVADDDDDDATPVDDDDDNTPSDDDDATPVDDDDFFPDDDDFFPDDDDFFPDDDDFGPGSCVPAGVLDCGAGSQQSGSNFPPEATSAVFQYSCFNDQWTGPEFTYELVAPADGDYTVEVSGFQGDLDLFLLDGAGDCDPDLCLDSSLHGPGEAESLTFNATAGESFYVVIDGFNGSISDFQIGLGCPATGDDDDTVADDDDTVQPDCPVFFAKGNSSRRFETWTWNGAGFDAPQTHNPSGPGTVWGAVVGDFDGDGDLDALSSRGNNYAAHFWSSNCDGTFDQTQVTSSGFTFPSGAEDVQGVADVDGDGDLDVYGWDYYSGAGVTWLNAGDGVNWTTVAGAFELDAWDPNQDSVHESTALGSYDLTGDGLPDLLECHNEAQSPTTCTVYAGVGDGTFIAEPGVDLEQVVNGIAVGDFDGDNAVDLLGGLDDDGDPGQAWRWAPSTASSPPYGGPGIPALDVNPGDESGNDDPGYGWMFPYDWDGDGDLDIVANVLTSFSDPALTLYYVENLGGADAAGWAAPVEIGRSDNSTGGDILVQSSVGLPVFN